MRFLHAGSECVDPTERVIVHTMVGLANLLVVGQSTVS